MQPYVQARTEPTLLTWEPKLNVLEYMHLLPNQHFYVLMCTNLKATVLRKKNWFLCLHSNNQAEFLYENLTRKKSIRIFHKESHSPWLPCEIQCKEGLLSDCLLYWTTFLMTEHMQRAKHTNIPLTKVTLKPAELIRKRERMCEGGRESDSRGRSTCHLLLQWPTE